MVLYLWFRDCNWIGEGVLFHCHQEKDSLILSVSSYIYIYIYIFLKKKEKKEKEKRVGRVAILPRHDYTRRIQALLGCRGA